MATALPAKSKQQPSDMMSHRKSPQYLSTCNQCLCAYDVYSTTEDLAHDGRQGEQQGFLTVSLFPYAAACRSPGARDRFPRVIFLAGEFPKARKAFADGASAVPEWAFLRWVSQMLGVTGREEGPVVIQVRCRNGICGNGKIDVFLFKLSMTAGKKCSPR